MCVLMCGFLLTCGHTCGLRHTCGHMHGHMCALNTCVATGVVTGVDCSSGVSSCVDFNSHVATHVDFATHVAIYVTTGVGQPHMWQHVWQNQNIYYFTLTLLPLFDVSLIWFA